MSKDEIIELTERVTSGMASDEEILLYNRLFNSFQFSVAEEGGPSYKNTDELQAQIKGAVDRKITKAKPAIRRQFFRYAVAAAVIILLGVGSYFLFLDKKLPKETISTEAAVALQKEIAPGKDGAVLTLANGKTIVLENAGNGKLTEQAVKKDNTLSYETASEAAVEYNTVSTSVGRQYSLVLADGSKVWLNAASSIRFPTAFIGKERTVELTGEGYFEVAHNDGQPFRVTVGEMDVQVLGTHFNINSYDDEEAIKTTLLEGNVVVKKLPAVAVLSPGQQAQVDNKGTIRIDKNADTEAVVAWKNGLFKFNKTKLQDVMRQLARWYDVDVRYEGTVKNREFSGEITRSANFTEVMDILGLMKVNVRLSEEGQRKVMTVTPD